MRSSHFATFAALTAAGLTAAGLTAAAALHLRAERRTLAVATVPPVLPVADPDGVVLPFVRPADAEPSAVQPAPPARCGETGGRTKAGSPCAARATTAGRCHHHPIAA